MKLQEAQQILVENGYLTEKTSDNEYLIESSTDKIIELSEFNRRMQRLEEGWSFIDDECNGAAKLYTIGKYGVGKFKFSLVVMKKEVNNPSLETYVRLLSVWPVEGSKKDLNSICERLFK